MENNAAIEEVYIKTGFAKRELADFLQTNQSVLSQITRAERNLSGAAMLQ